MTTSPFLAHSAGKTSRRASASGNRNSQLQARVLVIVGLEVTAMNLLLGLILGVLLTIGTAFVADAFSTSEVVSDACSKQIVNWDVAKERLHETTSAVATGWERLKGGVKSLE